MNNVVLKNITDRADKAEGGKNTSVTDTII